MKKKIMIILLIIVVFFLVGTFKYINEKSLNYKKTKEIILDTNGGVPYKWKCKISDKKIAKIKRKYSIDKSAKNVAGGPVEIHYVIKGIKKGNTSIKCSYVNFVNDSISKTKLYRIKVNEKLNLNILEK